MKQLLIEVEKKRDGLLYIPDNCWAFDAETKQLVTERTVPVEKAHRIMLVPKAAGG